MKQFHKSNIIFMNLHILGGLLRLRAHVGIEIQLCVVYFHIKRTFGRINAS